MTLEEVDRYNAEYFGVSVELSAEHRRLMGMPMGQWPENLKAKVKEHVDRYMLCGEVVADAVAEWLKAGGKS